MRLLYTLSVLIIAAGFALSAKLYSPPGFAEAQMRRALKNTATLELQGNLTGDTPFSEIKKIAADLHLAADLQGAQGSLHAQGSLANQENEFPFWGDALWREDNGYVRLSYAPLKLITNQWVGFENGVALPSAAFPEFKLIEHLPIIREDGRRFLQYAFQLISPQAVGQGTVLLDPKTYLPAAFRAKFIVGGENLEVNLRAIGYNRPINVEVPVYVRPAQEVLNQFSQNKERVETLPVLPLLSSPPSRLEAFTKDSDHDGLPDPVEQVYGTDPLNPDTDNDTYLDGDEIMKGYNPKGKGVI